MKSCLLEFAQNTDWQIETKKIVKQGNIGKYSHGQGFKQNMAGIYQDNNRADPI